MTYDLCIVINAFNRSAEIVITVARPVTALDHMNVCPVSRRMPITLIYKPVLCVVKTTKRRGHAASVMVKVIGSTVSKNGTNGREC